MKTHRNIKSRWWEFKLLGAGLNSQLPLCFLAKNSYVQWYVSKELIHGWIQCPTSHGSPAGRLPDTINATYNTIKYSTIIKLFPIAGLERFSAGTFVEKSTKISNGIKKKFAPRRSKLVYGAGSFKLTPDYLLPILPDKRIIYNCETHETINLD